MIVNLPMWLIVAYPSCVIAGGVAAFTIRRRVTGERKNALRNPPKDHAGRSGR